MGFWLIRHQINPSIGQFQEKKKDNYSIAFTVQRVGLFNTEGRIFQAIFDPAR